MKARFRLTRGEAAATFTFDWPVGGTSWDGTGTLVFESGNRDAFEELQDAARNAERDGEPPLQRGPLPEYSPPYLRKIDAIAYLAFLIGWEFEWIGDPPDDLIGRYEPPPKDAVS